MKLNSRSLNDDNFALFNLLYTNTVNYRSQFPVLITLPSYRPSTVPLIKKNILYKPHRILAPLLPPPDFIEMNSIHNVIFTELEFKRQKEKHVLISTVVDFRRLFFILVIIPLGYRPLCL